MKRLLLGILLCGALNAQNTGQNVVNQIMVNNVTYSVAAIFNTVPVQNIGQTSHSVRVQFSSVTTTVAFLGVIKGSTDCVNYFNIGPIVSSSNITQFGEAGNYNVSLNGYGAYPCVEVYNNISGLMAGSSAKLLEVYIGTSNPSYVAVDQFGLSSGMISSTGTGITGGGVQTFAVGGGGSVGGNLTVYGLSLSLPSTITSIELICGPNSSTIDSIIAWVTNYANAQIIWPLSLRPYFYCPPGDNLYYAASGTSGSGSQNYQYRLE